MSLSEPNLKNLFRHVPANALLLLPNSPHFTIVESTNNLLKTTQRAREELIGKDLFKAFPDNPADVQASGVNNLSKSLEMVLATKQPQVMNVQRYDIQNEAGIFEEHYWETSNSPVLDDNGSIEYIINTSVNITSKINSEKRATTTQENFEYFLNLAYSPFAILTGKEFVFTFANAAYLELMNGRTLVGKALDEAIPELKGQPFVSLLQNVFETGIPYHANEIAATALFYNCTEPTTRYFNLSYIPYKNQLGEAEGILASGFDITEEVELRKKAGKQILNEQAYNLFMQAPVGFSLVLGENHVVELANATGLELAGKGREIIGKTVQEILPGIETQGYIELLNRVKNNGESFNLKESPVTLIKNGKEETIYANITYQPYYEEGKIEGVLSISTDVTAHVLSRKEIEELKVRFETMANNIPNLAWLANSDGYIFWYNETWYKYTGTTPHEMEGWGWESVHHPDTLPDVLTEWQKSINNGIPFEMTFPIKGADGIYRPFLTRAIPTKDEKGNVISWVGSNTDITKQKEIEKMKDDFLSIASHELKTPLTTIKAYGQISEMLLQKKGDTETLGMITKMTSQVNRLSNLVDDLLDVTRLQKGKLEYVESFVDINKLIEEVIDDIQKTSITHTIKKSLNKIEKVFCDENKLSQALSNLILNAIKYSPNSQEILVYSYNKNGGVQLSVKDNGIGIALEDQSKVFQQFYRVEGDKQSTYPGMGIGLYITAEIIKNHGGKIWVESILNRGATFYVWLPLDHRTKH